MKRLAAQSRRSMKRRAAQSRKRKEAKKGRKGNRGARGQDSAKQKRGGLRAATIGGRAVRAVTQKRGLKNAMAFSRAFPQADQWSPEITVDDWDFAHKGPPIVPFRNLPCGPYRIKYSFGGGGDKENSLVLVLENAYGRQFSAWSPVSLNKLSDHISEAELIDFVGFGAADEEYGFPPVVIRLSHPPDSRGCPECAVFAKNNGKTDFGADIKKCFIANGPSGSEPDYSALYTRYERLYEPTNGLPHPTAHHHPHSLAFQNSSFARRPVRQKRRRECRSEMSVALEKERAKALVKIQSALKVFEEAVRRKLAEKIEKELVWGLDDQDIKELSNKLSIDSFLFGITEKILGRG